MTITISPWVVWVVACLALFGVWFLGSVAWGGVLEAGGWLADWWAARGEVIEEAPDLPPLPPERTWEQMTSHQLPVEPPLIERGKHHPLREVDRYLADLEIRGLIEERKERRPPWWEAEHRAAYESLGFDYPSGLMARVRELAP